MGPVDQDHGVEAAIQPNFGKRENGKTGLAPEESLANNLGASENGRVIVETQAILETKSEQDVPEAAPDVSHSPPPISRKGIQVFDDAQSVILRSWRHAMPRVEREKQAQQKPEGDLGPVPRSPDDPFREDRYACRSRAKSAVLPTATVRFSSGIRRFPPGMHRLT